MYIFIYILFNVTLFSCDSAAAQVRILVRSRKRVCTLHY